MIIVHVCPKCGLRSPCLELECSQPKEVECENCILEVIMSRHEEEKWHESRNLPRTSL